MRSSRWISEITEVTAEKLYEVLAGASTGGTSINHVCDTTEDSPHANTVCGHLTDQFDLNTVESVRDTLLQRDTLGTLPDRPVEVCTDLHFDTYHGEEEEAEALYTSRAKRGTTSFHAYATLYVIVRNKRYTLAVRQLTAGETSGDVLGEFLELLDCLDFGVKTVYLDRGFYNSTCLSCCTPTTTPTPFRSSSGAKRFKTSLTAVGALRLSTNSPGR